MTAAEEKLLRTSAAANKLTEANWKAFNSWVQAKDPNVPQTQQWLSENVHRDYPSFLCALLLLKLADCARHESSPENTKISFAGRSKKELVVPSDPNADVVRF